MSSMKWFDPICYQFSFYMLGKKAEQWNPIELMKPFWEELIPFYHLWMDLQGKVFISSKTIYGTLINTAKTSHELHDAYSIIDQRSHMIESYEISLVPDKTNSKFATPVKTIPLVQRQEVIKYTSVEDSLTLSLSQKAAWLCKMLNCSTDDLEGICFPQNCFETKILPLKIIYDRFDYSQLIQFQIIHDQKSNDDLILHHFHISLPRCMLRKANRSFDFQSDWEKQLLFLCNMFTTSFGCIRMDRYTTDRVSALHTGNGCFIPSFDTGIPDIAWGICLEQNMAEKLCQFNQHIVFSTFDKVLSLTNGHLYLQLTPDVSVVPKSKAKELWKLFSPQLCYTDYPINSISDVPVSFRLGISSDNLHLTDYGSYRIIR